jgi:hypothetical protein
MSNEQLAAWIAAQVGVSRSGARKWVYGERTPRGLQMVRVLALTDGLVTANDFLPLAEVAS